jgi:hypothetical protein
MRIGTPKSLSMRSLRSSRASRFDGSRLTPARSPRIQDLASRSRRKDGAGKLVGSGLVLVQPAKLVQSLAGRDVDVIEVLRLGEALE